jgi:hypothetical protein
MYKRENGWFEGEVVKVNQRLTSGSHQQYIPYIVWPQLEDVDGTEWVEEDTVSIAVMRVGCSICCGNLLKSSSIDNETGILLSLLAKPISHHTLSS